ncbi:MAG: tRNA (adenosine(37)-N6)-threonylcarbamoyltransferase complex transferase subunit TsaD [Candidatus Pacebacteria bacterium]|nr:tRNA (adenosine(37)-N6)-threonylcarbamoyltransferase complex transferase subunit TsaD [Candidatus Paceibacterota bacterium]
MRILAIETSCDETAIALLSVTGEKNPKFKIEAHQVASQIALHQQYGGVFPMMAKREHARNIVPLFVTTLKEAKQYSVNSKPQTLNVKKIQTLLEREQDIIEPFLDIISKIRKPKIDRIAVTVGPGLEPALWVGINFAKALSLVWDIPIVPVNHMEGHILSVFAPQKKNEIKMSNYSFPAISLLVSGGHTELVLVKGIGKYKLIGQTRDDAAGEAFDKVARMLELPYPGGPEISRLASLSRPAGNRVTGWQPPFTFPRPMLNSGDFDFSFSGLKTAVLYFIRDNGPINEETKIEIAREFEDAVCDVLIKKTLASAKKFKAKSIIVGGGVSANNELKTRLTKESPIPVTFPTKGLSTDNAIMIGIAGFFQKAVPLSSNRLQAKGNLAL